MNNWITPNTYKFHLVAMFKLQMRIILAIQTYPKLSIPSTSDPSRPSRAAIELYDLQTGRVITCGRVKVIPVTPMVVQAIEKLAEDQGIKDYKFKNRYGKVYGDADWIEGVEEYDDNNNDNGDPTF